MTFVVILHRVYAVLQHPVFIVSNLLPPVFTDSAHGFYAVIVVLLLAVLSFVVYTVNKNFDDFAVLEYYIGDIKTPR